MNGTICFAKFSNNIGSSFASLRFQLAFLKHVPIDNLFSDDGKEQSLESLG